MSYGSSTNFCRHHPTTIMMTMMAGQQRRRLRKAVATASSKAVGVVVLLMAIMISVGSTFAFTSPITLSTPGRQQHGRNHLHVLGNTLFNIGHEEVSRCNSRTLEHYPCIQRRRRTLTLPTTMIRPTRSRCCQSASFVPLSWLPASLHRDPSYCLTTLILLSTFGILLERRTLIGKALSVRISLSVMRVCHENVRTSHVLVSRYYAVCRHLCQPWPWLYPLPI